MKISAAFPSKYLKASDLNDKPFALTMDRVAIEEVGKQQDERPVLYFIKAEKGLVLNKTNSNIIAKLYGDDTDSWRGQRIELYPTMVDFGGEQVEAIRVRAPRAPQGQQMPAPPPPPPPPADHYHDIDDEIPF